MLEQTFSFEGSSGDQVTGRLLKRANRTPKGFALFAHCFTCGKDLFSAREITRALCEQGFGVFRFDFTGIGESEGEFSETNFHSNVEDVVAAADFLESKFQSPSLLIGHSFGGTASLVAASRIPSTRAVATIGSPYSPEHVRKNFEEAFREIEETGQAQVNIAGSSFTLKQHFLESIEEPNMKEELRDMDASLLILHSPQDEIVDILNAEEIYRNARHPKSFISLDGANHLLADKQDAKYTGRVIASWSERYLDEPDPSSDSRYESVQVHTGTVKYDTDISVRSHFFSADEPKSVGGGDRGPTPYELVSGGLGSCTSITLRMYADRKDWPLEEIQVEIEHENVHAEECKNCETDEGKVDVFTRKLKLVGDLTDEQRQRLLNIANKCPVHRTMESEIYVETRLIDDR